MRKPNNCIYLLWIGKDTTRPDLLDFFGGYFEIVIPEFPIFFPIVVRVDGSTVLGRLGNTSPAKDHLDDVLQFNARTELIDFVVLAADLAGRV